MILKALLVYKGKYERLFFFMYVWKVPSQQTKETDKKYEIFDFQVFQVRSWKTRNFFRVGFFIFWARIVPFWNMTKKWGCKAKFQKNIRNFFRENIRNDLGLESSISRNIRFFLVFLVGGGGRGWGGEGRGDFLFWLFDPRFISILTHVLRRSYCFPIYPMRQKNCVELIQIVLLVERQSIHAKCILNLFGVIYWHKSIFMF